MKVQPQLIVLLLAILLIGLSSSSSGSEWLKRVGQSVIQPAHQMALPRIVEHGSAIASQAVPTNGVNCHQVSCLALTFDDGPNPMTTPQVLGELEQAHVQATFFAVGSRVGGNEALLKRMYADGDEIGNHSWTHPDMAKLSAAQVQQQVELTQEAVIKAGVPPPTVFRPPYGDMDQIMEDNIHLSILMWNEDPRDWAASTPAEVVQAVEDSARPGGIVDMHDIYHVTADALPQILADLSARGYHFVTVDQLLNLQPASRGIYYGFAP